MCVAGKDSSWRERKSSLCLSWCFCFSGRSRISGFSISSSSSPRWRKRKEKRRSVKHKYFRWGRTMKSISGGKKKWEWQVNRLKPHTPHRGCTFEELQRWSPQGEGELCIYTDILHKVVWIKQDVKWTEIAWLSSTKSEVKGPIQPLRV